MRCPPWRAWLGGSAASKAPSNRWFKIASAYPVSPAYKNKRGINNADWIHIDRATYDACLDTTDYRKPLASKP